MLVPDQPRVYTTQGFIEHFKGDLNKAAVYATPGYPNILRDLIATGASLEGSSRRGGTLLHRCAGYTGGGAIESATILLEQGFDVNATDDDGNTPLMIYPIWPSLEWVQFMLARGADVSRKNKWDNTALHIYAGKGRVNFAFDIGGPFEYLDDESDAVDLCRVLVQAGAEVDARSKWGSTPLLEAVEALNIEVARYLLEQSADPFTTNDRGEDAMQAIQDAYMFEMSQIECDPKMLAEERAKMREIILEARARKGSP